MIAAAHSSWKTCQENTLSFKSFFIGLLYGAAGSGVIIAIITTKIDSISWKFTYIAIFSFLLIVSMALLSILMSVPLQNKIRIFPIRYNNIGIGAIAFLIGIIMLYSLSLEMNTFPII
ncbi:MAG: hypothetical protein R8G33_02665 [Gammaproteobacteria bacterium]|nr:hypothetical protein [Gammaproteobacteria bacterium]